MSLIQPRSLVRALFPMLLATVLTVSACDRGGGSDRPPEPGDRAVAEVQDETIWASDVKREAVAQGLVGEGEPLDVTSDLFRRVLDEVVDQALRHRLALHVGGPDGVVLHPRHGPVARLGRPVGCAAPAAGGENEDRREQHREQGAGQNPGLFEAHFGACSVTGGKGPRVDRDKAGA